MTLLTFSVAALVASGCAGDDDAGAEPTVDADVVLPDATTANVWRPAPGTTWQWQITGALDTSRDVDMYDVDLFSFDEVQRAALIDKVVICYFSAGSYEAWRPDVDRFPARAVGRVLDGWPDERWLDHRDAEVRAAIEARLDLAARRGCDGVEPDNVTAHHNDSGFPITAADQLDFNIFVANEAHERGLSVGLKNDVDQIATLEPYFDWALNEECAQFDAMQPFLDAGKAVFHTEYVDDWDDARTLADRVCGQRPAGFSTLIKTWDLGPEWLACP